MDVSMFIFQKFLVIICTTNCGDDKCVVEIKYQRHPHTSPLQVSYGVSMVSTYEKDDHVIVIFLFIFAIFVIIGTTDLAHWTNNAIMS